MKLLSKGIATGIVFLSGMAFMSNPVQAGWFSKKDDAETCRVKFEDKCQAVEEAKTECDSKYSDFYELADKLKSDIQSFKDAQIVSQKIAGELETAYESWKQDGFRINTPSYTAYAICKAKFAAQNREVEDYQDLVTSEMKDFIKFISSEKSKQVYASSLESALEAFYNYSAAVAREAVPTSVQQ